MPWASSRKLREGRLSLFLRRRENRRQLRIAISVGSDAGPAQLVGEQEQTLLSAVVQVALEPAALGVAGVHDARTGGAELLELRSHLGLELLVLDGNAGRGQDLLQESRLLEQANVVHERRNWGIPAQERSDRSARAGGQLDRVAGSVHVRVRLRPPVRQLECRIADGLRQRVADRTRCLELAQLHDEPRDGRSRLPLSEQCPADPTCECGEGDRLVTPDAHVEALNHQDPACQRVLKVPRDECQVHRCRRESGNDDGGGRMQRPNEPPDEQSTSGRQRNDAGPQPVAVERVVEPAVAVHEHEIPWALAATAGLWIVDRR